MTKEELEVILKKHKKWLNNEQDGEKANLWGADLWGADLRRANLQRADLREADLREANLQRADLREADLREANLWEANLWGANLWGADLRKANLQRADLREADLQRANLWGANLQRADLREADLRKADLRKADLQRANLRGADLREANLREANLWGANLEGTEFKDIKNFPYPDLYILKSVKGKIKAYKLVNEKNEGIFNGGLKYEIGEAVEVKDFDDDERILCSRGINIATLTWCKNQKTNDTQKILEVEFEAEDIVAIPYATDGKFRIKKCKVIKEVS